MNCQTCGYLLWNLPPSGCPECGRPFKPSDFEFRPNAVQYVCPHCPQVYYGTDATGHLQPRRFTCVNCGGEVEMDRMSVRPDKAVDEADTGRHRNPWIDRRRTGWLKGWAFTVGQSMAQPYRLIEGTPPTGGAMDAAAFLVVTTFLFHVVSFLPLMGTMAVMELAAGSGGGGPTWEAVFGLGVLLLALIVGVSLFAPVWALSAHAVLRVTGGAAHGLGRTWQAIAYGGGANVASAVPCLSFYFFWVGWIWWAVSSILMLARGQAVSGWRASLAVLLLPCLVVGGGGAWIGWQIYETVSFANSITTTYATTPQDRTRLLASGLVSYTRAQGQAPAHAAELVLDGHVTPGDFIDADTLTTEDDIPLGPQHTLDDLWVGAPSRQTSITQAAAAALPPDIVAHRVGDYVFTYHGIPLDAPPDPNLWIVILSPEPVVNAGWGWSNDIWVGTASGGVVIVPQSAFPGTLQAENQLRAQHGLPPIPDPATVTHQQPAVTP